MKWIETQINGASVRIAFDADSIHIFDAYPIKDDLKRQGFRWNPTEKSWFLKGRDPQEVLSSLSGAEMPTVAKAPDLGPSAFGGASQSDAAHPSLSVSQLRDRIEAILTRNLPQNLWVRGVIVSEVKSYRWASYFDLGDAESDTPFFFRVEVPAERMERIEAALSRMGVSEKLEKDLPVLLNVTPSLAQRYVVDVRLSVCDIVAEYTRSKLRSQRDVTMDRLKQEGIADRQRERVLPMLLNRIGLISSSQGTSVADIRTAMEPHHSRYRVLFADARMEGALAVGSIIAALRRYARMPNPPDLIVVARGGGSEQSLAVFNDYRLCREICLCPIPVMAAIGHEKDLSAAELCAHLVPAPSTPSGVGRFLAQRYQDLLDGLRRLVGIWMIVGQRFVDGEQRTLTASLMHLPQLLSQRLFREGERLARQVGRCDAGRMLLRLREERRQIDKNSTALLQFGRRLLQLAEERVDNKGHMISAHSPDRVLKRGFTLLFNDEGKVIGALGEFKKTGKGVLHFHDGKTVVLRGESGE